MEGNIRNEQIKDYVYELMENLNSVYKNIMTEKEAEKIINKFKDSDDNYDQIIKKINKIKQTIIKDFLNRQSKTETFINQIINSGNISNVKEFFGMSLNYELVYLLEKYEEINGSIFYSLEEKEEKFNNVKNKYLEKLEKNNSTIFPEIRKMNYQTISNIYNNFIEDVDVVSCEYETSMNFTVRKNSLLYTLYGDISNDIFDFSKAEKVYDFAIRHGKQIKFSSLVDYFPDILENELETTKKEHSRDITLKFLEEYIKTIKKWAKTKNYHFKQIDAIDKVLDENNKVNTLWEKALDKNTYYIDILKMVRSYFPDSKLIYTEVNEYIEEKTKKIVKLIKHINDVELFNEMKLIDGLNLELHYKKYDENLKRTINEDDIYKSMVMLSNLDMPIYRTEKHYRRKKVCIEQDKFIDAMIIADRICDVRGITICNNIESDTKPALLLDKQGNRNSQYDEYVNIYSKIRKEKMFDEIRKEEAKKLKKQLKLNNEFK